MSWAYDLDGERLCLTTDTRPEDETVDARTKRASQLQRVSRLGEASQARLSIVLLASGRVAGERLGRGKGVVW